MKYPLLTQLTLTVREALLVAGEVLRKRFDKPRRVKFKNPTSPVTQVDLESERRIVSLIRRRFPAHTFLAEESAFLKKGDLGQSRPGRYRWIIDPLDGTVNYIHGIPASCVSIAVEKGGTVLAGGVYDPFRQELFLARKGGGSTLNNRRIHVSKESRLERSLLITGFPYNRAEVVHQLLAHVGTVLEMGIDIRRFGAAALDLAWIACGRAEGFWEINLNPWDVAAGFLLVQEAGGKVTDFQGNLLKVDSPIQTLATNKRIHQSLLSRLFS